MNANPFFNESIDRLAYVRSENGHHNFLEPKMSNQVACFVRPTVQNPKVLKRLRQRQQLFTSEKLKREDVLKWLIDYQNSWTF